MGQNGAFVVPGIDLALLWRMNKYIALGNLEPASAPKWFLVANKKQAVIYQEGAKQNFFFVNRLFNEEADLRQKDLESDRPGRGFSSAFGVLRHALERGEKKHEILAKRFALKISKLLDVARIDRQYGELVIVAEPHFLGILRKSISSPVKELVSHELGREYKTGSETEIQSLILKALNRGGI